jgi:type IV pilus assembly protein PilN
MIKINLLPYRDILKKKNIFNHLFTAAVTLAGALLVIVVANLLITSRISAVERETVRVESEIATNKKIVEEIEKLKAEKELYRKQLEVIENLKKGTKGPMLLLDRLATSMPERTWLLSLKQQGANLEIVGAALDNRSISILMSNLKGSHYFEKVDLVTTEMKLSKGSKNKARTKMNVFTLTCSVPVS